MATATKPAKENKEEEEAKKAMLDVMSSIEREVLRMGGTPPNFRSVKITHVAGPCFRVNVRVQPDGDFATERILDSYFIHATVDGKIVTSEPKLIMKHKADED